jgi:hypothetical protein
MRPIFLFLLSLCFLSAGLNNHAHGDVHASSVSDPLVQHVRKSGELGNGERSQQHIVLKAAGLTEDGTSILSDEDDDNTSARKYLSAHCALILYYAIVLSFPCIYRKERLPFCTHLSYTSAYKYILQRSLRI